MVDREALLEECRVGWISVESDFKARLTKPESLKYGMCTYCHHNLYINLLIMTSALVTLDSKWLTVAQAEKLRLES